MLLIYKLLKMSIFKNFKIKIMIKLYNSKHKISKRNPYNKILNYLKMLYQLKKVKILKSISLLIEMRSYRMQIT